MTHNTCKFQFLLFSSVTFQESDPIMMDALKCTSALEVAHFFSIYDLHITEQQKIKFLSLTSTTGKYFSSVY